MLTYFLVLFFLSCKVEIGFKRRKSNPAFAKAKTESEESKLANTTNEESMPADTTSEESNQLIQLFQDPDGELRRFYFQKQRSEGVSVFLTKGE